MSWKEYYDGPLGHQIIIIVGVGWVFDSLFITAGSPLEEYTCPINITRMRLLFFIIIICPKKIQNLNLKI